MSIDEFTDSHQSYCRDRLGGVLFGWNNYEEPPVTTIDPDDVKMCDCSVCGRELLGESMRGVVAAADSDFIAGRVNDRPFCHPCLANRSGRMVARSILAEGVR